MGAGHAICGPPPLRQPEGRLCRSSGPTRQGANSSSRTRVLIFDGACLQVVAFEFGREVMEKLRQSNVASILEVMLTDIGAPSHPEPGLCNLSLD